MADNNQTFKLSLDVKEFTENALKANGTIEKLGSSENLMGLVDGILHASMGLAALGVAAFALKTTFDLVFEGEQIRRTNNLFDEMSKSIGVASEKFRSDLVGAAHGLADDTDIIQAANKAIVTMGDSAKKLPEVMELARKITVSFGGDLVERFSQINYAIASGSTRMLKQNGIMIDAQKAVKDYAKTLGVSADSLTEAGRRQAVMNAALEFGNRRIKDNKAAEEDAISTYQKLKVTIHEVGEALTVAFETKFGKAVRSFLSGVSTMAKEFKAAFNIGDAADNAAYKIQEVGLQIKFLQADIATMEANKAKGGNIFTFLGLVDLDKNIADAKAKITAFQNEIAALQEKQAEEKKKTAETGVTVNADANKEELINHQKVAEDRMKFENEILHLKQENAKHSIEMATDNAQLEAAEDELRLTYAQERLNKLAQMKQDYEEKGLMTHAQYLQMQEQVDQQFVQNLEKLDQEHQSNRERMDDNYLRHSTGTFDGIARAAKTSAASAQRDLNNFGKQGMMVMDTLKKRGGEAFESFGRAVVDHSQSASQIMKGFFLNTLADIAQAQGQLYLAMGFVDPTKLAAGAALMALSGALRAMAGSAGGGGGIGDSSGGGGVGSSYSSPNDREPQQAADPKKSVTLQVQGHYFETEQTKTKIMDLIRDATDATDFKYVQIGQS